MAAADAAADADMPPKRGKIGHMTKLVYAAPGLATVPFGFMFGMHGNVSYQAFGASISIIALSTALARSFDVLSDPLMSYWTDTASCGWLPHWLRGRRRPFMFFGAIFYSIALFLLMTPPYVDRTSISIYFGVTYTIFFLVSTFVCIPYDALAAELSDNSDSRVGLFFTTALFDSLGIMGAMSLPPLMTKLATQTSANDGICRSDEARAELCLAGRSCGGFQYDGSDGAHRPNATLASLLGPLGADVATPSNALRSCMSWLNSQNASDAALGASATAEQNTGFCECMVTCEDSCEIANRRTGFMFVGVVFAVWFAVAMLFAVCWVRERPSPARETVTPNAAVAPPLVPRLRAVLDNRPFRFLLPAWICEAFGACLNGSLFVYFLECVVAPAYQTMEEHGHDCAPSSSSYDGGRWVGMAGRESSETHDWMCSLPNIIALMGSFQNIALLCCMPLWPLLASKLGKIETWLLVSLLCMVFDVMKLFIDKGQVMFALIVFGLATTPHGGKFLSEVIMTDIIDYDEFLTGTRNEATYFMFKSFIPKIILIPASAIPLAMLRTFGYREPLGGRVQDQPDGVSWYIKSICLLNILCQLAALILKWNYPLRGKQTAVLAESLREVRAGRPAVDPISGRMYQPLTASSQEEERTFQLLGHFSLGRLRGAFRQDRADHPVLLGQKEQKAGRLRFCGKAEMTGARGEEEGEPKQGEQGKEQQLADAKLKEESEGSTATGGTPATEEEPPAKEKEEQEDQEATYPVTVAAMTEQDLCEGSRALVRCQFFDLAASIGFLVAAVVGTATTLDYLWSGSFGWVPTLSVVCIGAGTALVLLYLNKLHAAGSLRRLARRQDLDAGAVERLLQHRTEVKLLKVPARGREAKREAEEERPPFQQEEEQRAPIEGCLVSVEAHPEACAEAEEEEEQPPIEGCLVSVEVDREACPEAAPAQLSGAPRPGAEAAGDRED